MKIHQLSVFLENRPDQMIAPCKLLAGAGINIRTLTLADTEKFGILRLIVSDWQQGLRLLREAGYVVNVAEVVAAEVADHPGGLAAVLEALQGSEVNIDYMYAFTFGKEGRAVLIFRFDKPDAAIARFQVVGISVLDGAEVCGGIEA
ncbi:MAG: amino acid-binding protein [Candidatus Methylomirabilota bacterium]